MPKLFKHQHHPDHTINSMSTVTPDGEVITVSFENVSIDLDGNRPELSDSAVFTFHVDTEIADSRPRLLVDMRYNVIKSANSVGKVVFMGAEALHSDDLLYGSELNGEDQFVTIDCPGREAATGKPFTFTVAVFGHRISQSELLKIAIMALDIRRAPA